MSIGFNCCCAPNPCNCTWPRVLTYKGSVAQAQAAIYFVNVYAGGGPEPATYDLTFGARPAAIPKQLQLLYYSAPGGVHDPYYVTMPDSAWFSAPIPATLFGYPINVYFYGWMQGCSFHVMVIDAPYGQNLAGPDSTKGGGNNVISYVQWQCTPQFQMRADLIRPPQVTGTHGGDDITPGAVASLGIYCCARQGIAGGCTCP